MEETIIIGEFLTDCIGHTDGAEKRNWKTLRLKSLKYATSTLKDGSVFCFHCLSEDSATNFFNKIDSMGEMNQLTMAINYYLIGASGNPNLQDIIDDYKIQTLA